MKTLNNLLVPFIAILISTAAMSYTVLMVDSSTEKLRTEISSKLRNIDLSNYDLNDYDVKVQFTINDKNELVVLSTDHSDLDQIIKKTLNYKTVKVKDIKRNSLYSINIKLKTRTA